MFTLFWAVFNLFLVGLAFAVLLIIERQLKQPKSTQNYLLIAVLCLIFILLLPNITYLFTDHRHIADICIFDELQRCTNSPWRNLGYFVYSALGIPFFLISIRRASGLFFPKFQHLWVIALIFLSALGVRIGLFERFNSWDILNTPGEIIITSLGYVFSADEALYSFFGLLMLLYYWSWFWLDRFR